MAKEEEEKRLESLVEQSKAPDSEEVKEAAANSPEDSKQENIEANENGDQTIVYQIQHRSKQRKTTRRYPIELVEANFAD